MALVDRHIFESAQRIAKQELRVAAADSLRQGYATSIVLLEEMQRNLGHMQEHRAMISEAIARFPA